MERPYFFFFMAFWFVVCQDINLFLCPYLHFLMNSDIRNWIRNIEQHASDNVNKILVGNKADMDESKRVRTFSCFCCYNLCACTSLPPKIYECSSLSEFIIENGTFI